MSSAAILGLSYGLSSTTIGYDGEQYLTYARNILTTGQFTYDGLEPSCGRAPGYPAFLAAVLYLFGDLDWLYPIQMSMLLISYGFVAAALTTVARDRALVLVALSLLWPLHRLALGVFSEPLFFMLTSVGMYALSRHRQSTGLRPLLTAALLLGLSALVRPVNLFAFAFLSIVMLLRHALSLRHAVLGTIVSILVVTPWTVRNFSVFGKLVPIAAHHGSIYYMTDAEVFWPVMLHSAGYSHSLPIHREIVGDDLELDASANDRYWQRASENIKSDPLGFVARCAMKTVFIWSYLPGTKGLIFDAPVLFALGVIVQLLFLYISGKWVLQGLRANDPVRLVVAGYALYSALILMPFYAESRMLLPVYIWLFGGVMTTFSVWYSYRRTRSVRLPA